MADIFLAYSSANSKKAEKFKSAFEAEGLSVFDDQSIPTGQDWRRHIEDQLSSCQILVVLWSKTAVESNYVKEEADVAKEHNKLFPVMITKCAIPYGFRTYQTKNLISWRGDRNDTLWQSFMKDIRGTVS